MTIYRLNIAVYVLIFFNLSAGPATTRTTAPTTRTTAPTTRTIRTTAPVTTQQTVVAPGPEAPKTDFPLAQAATQAESASITLRSIETDISNDREVARVEGELPLLTTEIDSRMDESAKLLAASPSLQLLGEQEQDWTAIDRNLTEWGHQLQRRNARLSEAKAVVAQLRTTWDREQQAVDFWYKYAKSTDLLDKAQTSVADTRSLIDQTAFDLRESQIKLFTIDQAVDGQAARVKEVLNSVRQARDEAFNQLLVRDSAPLWELLRPAMLHQGLVEQGQQSFLRQLNAVGAYLHRRIENLAGQIGVLIVLTAILYWVRNKTRDWAKKDPDLEHASRVFASPIATALVLSLLLSAPIYPQAPRLLWAIIGAAALIPTVVILRRLIDSRWSSVLNALVVFYFLDQVRSIAAVVPGIARVLLLIEMIGGVLLLIGFLRSNRRRPTGVTAPVTATTVAATAVSKLRQLIVWIWLAALLLATLGDVLGYASLANLLGDAALGSAYVAVILYACTRIISGFLFIALRSRPLESLTMVRRHQQVLLRRLNLILNFIAANAWVVAVFASISIASSAWDFARRLLARQLGYGQIHISLGNVLEFAFTIWASVQISRFVRFVLEEDVYDRFKLPGGIPYAISKMLNYIILLLGFFIAVSALGYDMTKFTILAGAFGVGLGFGMQNIVNNFVSGLILLFERPVKVGDVIQMDDTTGIVGHIGIRASVIRTLNSAEIIVPNGNLISNKVTNWTLSNRQRGIEIKLAVGSTSDPKHVMSLLTTVAAAHPAIIKSPPPEAFLTSFAADAFSYELHAWTNNADQWVQIRSDLAVAIHAALTKENIAIK